MLEENTIKIIKTSKYTITHKAVIYKNTRHSKHVCLV